MTDQQESVLQRWRNSTYTNHPTHHDSLSPETIDRRHQWDQALLWLMTTSISGLKKKDTVQLLGEVQQLYRSLTLAEKQTAGLTLLTANELPDTSPLTPRPYPKKSPPWESTQSPT